VKVAVAIIVDQFDRVLITQRPLHASHGGFWEFPGGKLETNESAIEALKREIKEEVGLQVLEYHLLDEIKYQYPDKQVELIVFYVSQFSGEPFCLEGQLNMRWAAKQELNPGDFPLANQSIIEMLQHEAMV